ncbi:histamine H3 receptor-like [Hyla sarda]|uniref:histamine H3 receptor-like n=1 Tax=Hyla sarda TaxID=327740 RepID=UPI0024C27964|nr:histamine H3 receptor-like [Hyla sarda]
MTEPPSSSLVSPELPPTSAAGSGEPVVCPAESRTPAEVPESQEMVLQPASTEIPVLVTSIWKATKLQSFQLTKEWRLGKYICKLWLVTDYMMSTASVLNIVLISFDRFVSVTQAVHYQSLQKRHSVTFMKMTAVWVMSFLLYSPSIFFWDSAFGNIHTEDDKCLAGFFNTWYFHLATSVFDFFLPLICISFFNVSIYWSITKRSRKRRQHSAQDTWRGKTKDVRPFVIASNLVLPSTHVAEIKNIPSHIRGRYEKSLKQGPMFSSTFHTDNSTNTIHIIKLSRDKKVAKSLAILVSVFAVCWAPYTFLVTIDRACQNNCVAQYWYDVTVYILYFNSAINPILYPLCHKSFRKAFSLLLQMCLRKWTVYL